MKRILSILVALMVCALPLMACAEERATGVIDEISVSVSSDVSSLAPYAAASTGRQSVLPTLYEYLAYYDAESETGIRGILMKDYTALDEDTYRITIYDYIYDSAGNHITAEDVAYCFNTYHDLGISGLAYLMSACEVVDEYTVDLTIGTTQTGMFENIICGQVPIVSKEAYEGSPDEMANEPVSTSPYLVTEYISGSRIVCEKNPNYWQKDDSLINDVSRANANKITFHIITEASQVSINLETNAIDIAQKMTTIEANRFISGESTEGFTVYASDDPNLYVMFFNMSDNSVFKGNLDLRQAICYAIDLNGVVQGATNGSASAAKAMGNRMCVDYNPAWDEQDYYDYDLNKAKELLSSSGFDTSITLRVLTASTPTNQTIAQIVQAYLGQIGIKAELNICDSALFKTNIDDPTAWDLCIDTRMSNDYVTTLSSILAPYNGKTPVSFVEDEAYGKLALAASSSSTHSPETVEAYMQYTKDTVYVYALMTLKNFYITNDKVADVFVNYKGLIVPGACTFYAE